MKRLRFQMMLFVLVVGWLGHRLHAYGVSEAIEHQRLEWPFLEFAGLHPAALRYGSVVTDFRLKDANGRTFRLSRLCRNARLTLLAGFSLEDQSSIAQMIDLREAYNDLKSRGLAVVGVYDGISDSDLRTLRRRYTIVWPLLNDPDGAYREHAGLPHGTFALLLRPDRRVLYSGPGRPTRREANLVADKAYSELTGTRITRAVSLDAPSLPPLAPGRPVVLDDIDGAPVPVPGAATSVDLFLSPGCRTCPETFERARRAWNASRRSTPLTIVFVDTSADDPKLRQFAGECKRELPTAAQRVDPTDLLRRRIGYTGSFGSAVVLDPRGTVVERIPYRKDSAYESALTRAFSTRTSPGKEAKPGDSCHCTDE